MLPIRSSFPARPTSVSSPPSPNKVSLPSPPLASSSPGPARNRSLPPKPKRMSLPSPPSSSSSPDDPISVSSPSRPRTVSLPPVESYRSAPSVNRTRSFVSSGVSGVSGFDELLSSSPSSSSFRRPMVPPINKNGKSVQSQIITKPHNPAAFPHEFMENYKQILSLLYELETMPFLRHN